MIVKRRFPRNGAPCASSRLGRGRPSVFLLTVGSRIYIASPVAVPTAWDGRIRDEAVNCDRHGNGLQSGRADHRCGCPAGRRPRAGMPVSGKFSYSAGGGAPGKPPDFCERSIAATRGLEDLPEGSFVRAAEAAVQSFDLARVCAYRAGPRERRDVVDTTRVQ